MIESLISKPEVVEALQVLKKLNEKYYDDLSKKKPLLETESSGTVFLQVALKKVPKTKSIKIINVNLPHSLASDTSEVCLIAGDLDKRNHKAEIEPDILHYKDLLKKQGITEISEIVTLRQLRTEYKPYEAKQKLLAAYDVFLTDNRITECLPRVLGKHFFKKRKFPIQLNLKTRNLKEQISKALSRKQFYFTGRGDSCASEVAYLDMDDSKIVENVLAMVQTLSEQLPGHADNIKGIHIRTARSKAIPLYISYDNEVQVNDDIVKHEVEFDDLPTFSNKMVKVFSNGRVKAIRVRDDKIEAFGKYKVKEESINIPDKPDLKSEESVEEEKKRRKKCKSSVQDKCISVADKKNLCLELDEITEVPSDSIREKKQVKKAKKKSLVDSSPLIDEKTEKEDHVKSPESDVLDETVNEKKQSKKAKIKNKQELSSPSNDLTTKDSPTKLTDVLVETVNERKQSKKAKTKNKQELPGPSNDLTTKESPTKLSESDVFDVTVNGKKQSKKAKTKQKLLGPSNDLTNKESPTKLSESDVLDKSVNEKKQSKKAKGKNKQELSSPSNDLIIMDSPTKLSEYPKVEPNIKLSERIKKLKKSEKELKSLCDNSNSSETTAHQKKKAVNNEEVNLGKTSKKKYSVINETSFEESNKETKKLKRKRDEEFINNEVKDESNRTPIQTKKKAKRENVNKIQSIAMKEAVQARQKVRESRHRKAKC